MRTLVLNEIPEDEPRNPCESLIGSVDDVAVGVSVARAVPSALSTIGLDGSAGKILAEAKSIVRLVGVPGLFASFFEGPWELAM